MNPTEARRRIDAIRADTAHPFFAESHPGHTRAGRDMEALYAHAYPEPVNQNPLDQPVPIKASPPADPGLKHREPGVFWQESAPIPREELEAAQQRDRGAGAWGGTDALLRAAGESVADAARQSGDALRLVRAELAAAGKDFLKVMTPKDSPRQRAYFVAHQSPKWREAYRMRVYNALSAKGAPLSEMTADDIVLPVIARNSPDHIVEGYILEPGSNEPIWIGTHKPLFITGSEISDGFSKVTGAATEGRITLDPPEPEEPHREYARRRKWGLRPPVYEP